MRWGSRRVVFVSDKLKQDLQPALKIPNSICSVIQNGVDIDRFARPSARALRTELGLRPDSILVGAIGNIRHAKAYDVFLRAAKILKTLSPRYRFAIAGEGSGALYEELLRLRAELGLGSDLAFLGLRSDIPQIVQSLDIFALSSITEGFSLACVEAMAARIPVVATRCGGPEEIIVDESSGLLVQPRSPEALAKAIHRIAFDQELSVRLAANALNRVRERYAVGAMVGAYDQLFRQLLESAPGAGSLQR
jgi:glycosyltransferase involved in cell wall biosynthesis